MGGSIRALATREPGWRHERLQKEFDEMRDRYWADLGIGQTDQYYLNS
jgi:hypothetical protein